MRPLHRTQPDEATTLAMENELLRLEVVHVRARLLAAEAELRRIEKTSANAAGNANVNATGNATVTSTGDSSQPAEAASDALTDLQWLLRRIEATPLARVLGRRDGYRRLVDTYLREDAG